MKSHALSIFKAGLRAADPAEAVARHVRVDGDALIVDRRRYDLRRFSRILVIGAGKAGASMSAALERLLGRRISDGLVNVKDGHTARLRRVRLNECRHPIPDERGVEGAKRIAEIASEAREDDLVLCVISGGASALLPLPAPPVTLGEKQQTTQLLLDCGANIHEINAVRKHISAIKGGQLARLASPATVVSLLLSDVIGDDLAVIGSGPTAPDPSTFEDAAAVLDRYGLRSRVPLSVRQRLERGAAGSIEDTPKSLDNVQNVVIGSNRLAVNAAAAKAKELGYRTLVLSTVIEGETREVARMHAAIAREIVASGQPVKAPACVLSGGETTVTIRGKGLGGRNQEFALAAAVDIDGLEGVVVLSAGTDGTDGPTDAAGAWADANTAARARAKGMDAKRYLSDNDSYRFFDALGNLIKTGPTGTNVMDLRIVLVGTGNEKRRHAVRGRG
jgi:glycerate 2-kinase